MRSQIVTAQKSMSKSVEPTVENISPLIRTIRGQKAILDFDLARVFGVPTFRFNEAVKRNRERFPDDFLFQLTAEELQSLTSQFAILKQAGNPSQIAMGSQKHRNPRHLP
jgi:ORF6N domain